MKPIKIGSLVFEPVECFGGGYLYVSTVDGATLERDIARAKWSAFVSVGPDSVEGFARTPAAALRLALKAADKFLADARATVDALREAAR